MRFGSIRAFLKFIQMLEGVGYSCQHPLYDIEEGIKRLPDFISNYKVEITPYGEQLEISLKKNKEAVWRMTLQSPSR